MNPLEIADASGKRGLRVLVIEGDETLLLKLTEQLELEGYVTQAAKNRAQASVLLRSLRFDGILSEVTLPDGDCEQIYRDARPFVASTPIIFLVSSNEIDQAIRLVRAGAADCVQKPFDVPSLIKRLRAAIDARQSSIRKSSWPEPIMKSAAMLELGRRLKRLAVTNVSVFIAGESGSGKEVIARHLHRISPWSDRPFVAVRCASLVGSDGDRLLFGELLRPTGGGEDQLRFGALEQAGRGFLFLDEVDEMPLPLQSKLVQVIDGRKFSRIGQAGIEISFEARTLISSDLPGTTLVERMHPDLFGRLAVVELAVPPLRDRQADLEAMVNELASEIAVDLGVPVVPIDAEAFLALRAHEWPGNVRELRNRLTRALSFLKRPKIDVEDLFPDLRSPGHGESYETTLEKTRANAERQHIVEALALHNGRIGDTALSLGISRVTLWAKMKKLGLT